MLLNQCQKVRKKTEEARKQVDIRQSGGRILIIQDSFDFFYNTDPYMALALKLRQVVEEGLVFYRNIFRKIKKQKKKIRQNEDVFPYSYTKWGCLSCLPPLPSLPPLSPLPPQSQGREQDHPPFLLLSLPNVKKTRMKTFMMIHFHLMNSK